MTTIVFEEFLARPGKNELLYSREELRDGMVYYLALNYYDRLISSFKDAIKTELILKKMSEEESRSISDALNSATDYDNNDDIPLYPHIFSM